MKPVQGLALGGRYHLVRRIAVGGMGEVWVAQDSALGRDVAVKVLREEFAGEEDFLQRLRTEARNNARLSHPGIAQMYDYGEQGGTGYLIMELVHGEPMSDLLEREPVVPVQKLLPILSQAARGLHAAHVAGVVHRDVKPGNILLERTGGVKLTDFGVSLAANQVPMTATGMVMGTAQYLSPEQAIGKAATPASDVYALGIVAFEALMGKRPFTGPTPVDIAVAHVNQPVPPLAATVDRELAGLVRAALAKDPAGRPRTAAVLAQAFDAIAARIVRDQERHRGARPTEVIATTTPRRPAPPAGAAAGATAGRQSAHDARVPGAPAGAPTPGAEGSPRRSYPPRRVVQSRVAANEGADRASRPPGRHREAPAREAPARDTPARDTPARPTARHEPARREAPAAQAPAWAPTDRRDAAGAAARPSTPRTRADLHRTDARQPDPRSVISAGGIGPLSWPAVALVVLAVVVVVAALIGLGGRGDASSMSDQQHRDGMIVLSTSDSGSAQGSPTSEKDG